MNPLLPALALTGCYVLALRGIALIRDRGPTRVRAASSVAGKPRSRGSLVLRMIDAFSDRLAPRATRLLGPTRLAKIRRSLDAAGKPRGMTVEGYAGRKLLFTLLFSIPAVLLLLEGNLVVAVVLVAAGWLWIDIWLSGAARRRQDAIDRELPDFLDVLAVTVGAGVGFRPALVRVAEAVRGPLGEEVMTALHQMELGASRRDALEALRRRNESEALAQFVTALLQAEELGVPLTDALVDLAADMRRATYQSARRRAARAAPRVSLIVSALIVPGAVILIAAALLVGSDFDLGSLLGG